MKIEELAAKVKDVLEVRRVYGEPFEKDGVTVIPAATLGGGAGGGNGHDAKGAEGEGGGFGIGARPAGAYVISGDKVRWVPAVDVDRLVLTAGAVAALFAIARMIRR